MTFGSLFSGIGGIDLGLERAGMGCKWQVEIDDYCQRVLAKHWPEVARYRDVKECGGKNLESVDLICGGFPCQPWSVAGKRRGADDDRNLWPETMRVIGELRPQYIVLENVPGIIPNPYFDQILDDLDHAAYEAWPLVIPAAAFDAPHFRYRVFIVAYAEGKRLQRDRASRQQKSSYGKFEKRSKSGFPFMGSTAESWPVEPNVGRVAYGIPSRVDRLRALGNAVVPQAAEWIGQQIVKFDNHKQGAAA